ncbi:hypothetical protein E0493_22770 [Roseomonas sp. M0104]|uniref:DUF2971 domain-containing protein n=1 Tax=Teichococcus coralli TaxID=2545983 RepID=A0A845BGM3_9PROT|nr:hypothetical protein [Pseudoroseomonas coralli]
MTETLNISVPDDTKVWRYMDFAKFVAMLTQKGLYFPRVDKLEDSFEGATGLGKREEEWDRFYLNFFRSAITSPPGASTIEFSPEDIEDRAQRLLRDWKSIGSRDRTSFVSCWHANTGESEALWRLYCPPATAGVAVQTTVRALWDATENEPSSVVGRVHYLDFRKSFADPHYRVFCKRASLSHENEVRVVVKNEDNISDSGKLIPADLGEIIQSVAVSPFAPSWFDGVVREVITNFGFIFEVRTSEILERPFF